MHGIKPSAVLSRRTYAPYVATPDTVAENVCPTNRSRYSMSLTSCDSRAAFSAMRSMSEECSAIHGSADFSWSNFSGRPPMRALSIRCTTRSG